VLSEPLSKPIKAFYWLAEKLGAWLGTYTITVSEVDRELALRYRLTSDSKITTIYNGIDTVAELDKATNLEALKAELNLPNNKFLIGTIANFYPTKGLSFFLRAAALIKQTIPDTHFVLIGDGEERVQLLELVEGLGLSEDITFLGRLPNAGQLTSIFEMFIMSSIKEGLPFALLEAMAEKCPVIATRVGGIPEVLGNNEFGLLVNPADASALAEAAIRLLQDPVLTQQLGEKARLHILTNFTIEQMINQTSALYRRLLSEAHSNKTNLQVIQR
jgi:glycosyltransferase involved in cell wall biosynthesis